MSQYRNQPANPTRQQPGFTKLEEASLRLLQAGMQAGYQIDNNVIVKVVKTADQLLKAANHYANNGSFDNFEDK